MSTFYWLLNVCLVVLATATTVWLGGAERQQMFEQPEEIEGVSEGETETVPGEKPQDDGGAALGQHMDTLWQRTLFRPERTEAVSLEQEENEDDEPERKQERFEMELIGLGRIGDKSATVIRVKKTRGGRSDKKDLKKNVYRLNDSVQDTGFEVTDIALDKVTLSRGDETRELTLTKSDSASKKRRKEAVRAEKQKEKERKKRQQEKEEKEDKPEPPPPPPAPGAPDSEADEERGQAEGQQKKRQEDEELTKRERIKRALEARRRILEKRRKARQEEGQ